MVDCHFFISVAFHFFSSVSAKAVMRNRKITGDRLSSWQTPTIWSISACSFPIFRVTLRSVYSLLIAELNLGGAPYFTRMSMMRR